MTYTIKIGSTDISGYLKGYTVERNKLWTGSDRNMNGDLKATYIGVFPKIGLEFTYLSEANLKTVIGLLDGAVMSVTYWNSVTAGYKTANFYCGDFAYPIFDKSKGMYKPFNVNLISYNKYS